MRVLDTYSGQFVDIDPREGIHYAILSHTWNPEGEQTYQALLKLQQLYQTRARRWWRIAKVMVMGLPSRFKRYLHSENRSSPRSTLSQPPHDASLPTAGPADTLSSDFDHVVSNQPSLSAIWADPKLSPKIREACRIARENGYQYIWIDSCCIDKTSSSELSESINSMYQWYALAYVCYTFLADVPAEEDHQAHGSDFRLSRWFKRGWTLQELIAPLRVVFLAEDWTVIGSKLGLVDLISEITKVDCNALLHVEPLDEFSVAQRLSWAANRVTTRVEDRAYSLLGIFDINMPTLYGEGERAFRRLQEEIMRRTPDQSLFAWTRLGMPASSSDLYNPEKARADKEHGRLHFRHGGSESISLLAPSLDVFGACAGIEALSHDEVVHRLHLPNNRHPARDYDFTPYGVRIQLPMISFSSSEYFPLEWIEQGEMDIPLSQWYLIILGCRHRDFPEHLLGRICYIQSSGSSINFIYSGYMWRRWSARFRSWSTRFDLLPISRATIMRLHASHICPRMLYIPQPRRDEGANDLARRVPHETIRLVLSKNTREDLSTQGYTAILFSPDEVDPTTHSVILAHDIHTRTIFIYYQHTLARGGRQLTIKAFVQTSSGGTPQDTSGGLGVPQIDDHAGRTAVSWTDVRPWRQCLGIKNVELDTPEHMASTLSLGLNFVTNSHYLLQIELQTANITLRSDPVVSIVHESDAGGPSTA